MAEKNQFLPDDLPEDLEMTSPRQQLDMNPAHITIVNIPSIPCETMDTSQDNMSISTTGDIDSSALNYSEIGLPYSAIQANTLESFNHNGTSLQTGFASLGYSERIQADIQTNTQERLSLTSNTASGRTANEEMGYSEIEMPQTDIQAKTLDNSVTSTFSSLGKIDTSSVGYSEIENLKSDKTLEDIEHGSLKKGNVHRKLNKGEMFSFEYSAHDYDKISKHDSHGQYPTKDRYEVHTPTDILITDQKRPETQETKPRGLSRDNLTIPLSSSFDSNLVNFNSPEVDKEPQSLKEMEKLFSHDHSNDANSVSKHSKGRKAVEGRQPLSNFLELENRHKVRVGREGIKEIGDVKVYNKKKAFKSTTKSDTLNKGDTTKRRVLGGSFEELPGTGKHVRNIYIKGTGRYTKDSHENQNSPRRRSRSTESEIHGGNQGRVAMAKTYFDSKKNMKNANVDSTLQPVPPMRTTNGRSIPKSSNLSSPMSTDMRPHSTDSMVSVAYSDIDSLKQSKDEGNFSKNKRISSDFTISSFGDKKKNISDLRDGEKQITSLQSPRSGATSSPDIQVSVTSNDDSPESKSLVPHSESKRTRRRGKGSRYDLSPYDVQRVALPKRNRDDNINVYVNVNVNMIQADSMDQRTGDVNQNTIATTLDESKDLKSDSSQASDKTLRSEQDFEFSSSDGDSFNQDFMMFRSSGSQPEGLVSDNLSVNYYADQFRMMNNLGVRGLSPIPSVSYESDSTNRQLDWSSADSGKVTPTAGECPSVSSESTLKDDHSDNDSVDLQMLTERHYFKSQGKSAFAATDDKKPPRKLSFNDEVVSIPDFPSQTTGDDKRRRSNSKCKRDGELQPRRTVVSRSHSQPEQYLMQKRQSAITQMSAQQSSASGEYMNDSSQRPRLHSWHKSIYKQNSEGLTGARYIGFTGNYEDDNRLPLNVRAPTSPISNDDNDRAFPKAEGWTRFDFSRSSWHMRSPYSSRVRRTSSLMSDGSRSGKRVRQLSVDIGEEWESVHKSTRPRTVSDASSVFSYRSLRQNRNKDRVTVEDRLAGDGGVFVSTKQPDEPSREKDTEDVLLHVDVPVAEEIESPISEVEGKDTEAKGAKPVVDQPQAVVVEVAAEREDDFFTLPPEKRILLNNPYNDINQRFHSTLHCPCFIFFCFLCCAPAVYWMQRSDYEFDYASEKLAKKYGRRATILYVTGAILSVLLLTGAIVATVILLEDHLTADTAL